MEPEKSKFGFTVTDFEQIPSIPVYKCTESEFKDPMKLIQELRRLGYDEYGCVKLIPPKSFKPPFCFNGKGKLITTRKQILQDLSKAEAFEQNVDAYTFEEFEKFANAKEKKLLTLTNTKAKNPYRAHEFDYWSIVDHPEHFKKEVEVEYAADISSFRFGSAFPCINSKGKKRDDMEDENYETAARQGFNLNVITSTTDSLFQVIKYSKDSISGITSPWVYVGMLYATFCWHVEDNYMYSINYSHRGAGKTWYCVPGKYKEEFDKAIKSHYADLFSKNPHAIYSICLMMNPLDLRKRKIPVYRTDQEPGEFILTFPKAYHSGFSHGFNVGEAVNLATSDWLDYSKQAFADSARENFVKKSSFTHDWIVVENIRKITELSFTKPNLEELLKHYEEIKKKELDARKNVFKAYSKIATAEFPNKECRYDLHTCTLCKNYTYLSYISCDTCDKKACTWHISVCECLYPKVSLFIRYGNDEMNKFGDIAKKLLKLKKPLEK